MSERRCRLLRPRSDQAQRTWVVGEYSYSGEQPALTLPVCNGDLSTFASVRQVLASLDARSHVTQRAEIANFLAQLNGVAPWGASLPPGAFARILTDGVAFSILRRISRESIHTSPLIQNGAVLLNKILRQLPYQQVVLPCVDKLDRPSLKVFARAALLLQKNDEFAWVWQFSSDVIADKPRTLIEEVRRDFFSHLFVVISPSVDQARSRANKFTQTEAMAVQPKKPTPSFEQISSALVLQNYCGCLDMLDSTPNNIPESERNRITALVAVNVGRLDIALSSLDRAAQGTVGPRAAHLSYLKGLIHAKRQYDLTISDHCYREGLASLDNNSTSIDGDSDPDLERAWLHNGLALNSAIRFRRAGCPARLSKVAFDELMSAFNLVREGSSAARLYLRFNIVSNMSLLMELQREYDVAIALLEQAFGDLRSRDHHETLRWRVSHDYRVAILNLRRGAVDIASKSLMQIAHASDNSTEHSLHERVLRGLGEAQLASQRYLDAEQSFRTGVEIGQRYRFENSVWHHGAGVVSALIGSGNRAGAEEFASFLHHEEEINLVSEDPSLGCNIDNVRPPPVSTKLPAYYPEIDLEDVPKLDLNRFLGGQDSQAPFGVWT
ncbi:tetratricopeptide (TPR) repeat protein [Bradyrhizobium diazoefficiens]